MLIEPSIALSEFQSRRQRVLKALDGAVGVVFAGEGAGGHGRYSPDANFAYLTGVLDEPGAAVLFDPKAEDPSRRAILFLKPSNPEMERWDGYRDPISESLKDRVGFGTIMRTTMLPRMLTQAARKRGRVACLHPFAVYDAPVSPDLVAFRKVGERVLGVRMEDQTNLIASMRAIKSKTELAVMQRAIDASAAGYRAVARAIKPGVNERQIQKTLEDAFLAAGGTGTGYTSIVGAGLNSTVLHYTANNAPLAAGDVLLIDAGARADGYTADVTRVFPVSGKFSKEQRRIYDIVLEAQEAAIAAVRPGVEIYEVDAAARKVIAKAGYADTYIHGVGHQLGMEVHDATPDGPFQAGMVVTIEPGIYLPEQRIGVRIEDDVLVTSTGRKVLTSAIPKEADEVEAMMRGGR